MGLFVWYSITIPNLRPYISNLIEVTVWLNKRKKSRIHQAHVPTLFAKAKEDLKSAKSLLTKYPTLSFEYFRSKLPLSHTQLYSDASAPDARYPHLIEYWGLGGHFMTPGKNSGVAWQWSKTDIDTLAISQGVDISSWNIARYEFLGVIINKGKFAFQWCDNSNVVTWFQKKRCRFPMIDLGLQEFFERQVSLQSKTHVQWISSANNSFADELSRNHT